MRRLFLFVLSISYSVLLVGCGMQESMITEEIFEPIIENPSSVEEASVSDMEGGTKRYAYQEMYDPEVPYIPELDYHTFVRVCPTDRYPYICWKDMLILGNVIYKRENGVYTKTKGSLSEWLGIKNDLCLYQFNQWENFLILSDIDQLVIFDMDSEELVSYPFEHGYNWYVFQGKVYYREVGKGVLCMDIQSGKNEVIYACKGGGGMCIRDNGDIIISTGNEINPKVWEFWLLSYNVQGDMDARKIWETDKYKVILSAVLLLR